MHRSAGTVPDSEFEKVPVLQRVISCRAAPGTSTSNQLQPLEAGMAVLADDDVVVHGNAERLGDVDDRLRHLNVGARRRRVAGRMIVHQSSISAYRIEPTNIFVEARIRWGMGLGSVVNDPT